MNRHSVQSWLLGGWWIVAALFGLAAVAQADGNTALRVTPNTVAMSTGQTAQVAVAGASGSVSVASADSSVVMASYAKSVVTLQARRAGSTAVTVRDARTGVRVKVTVTAPPPMTLSPTSLSLAAGASAVITVANASGALTATTSDAAVATAAVNGSVVTVAAIKAGTISITVRDPRTSITVPVSVAAGSSSAFTVTPAFVSMSAGGTATLTLANASGGVTATSADTTVATVVVAGNRATVSGVKAGSAVITFRDRRSSALVQILVVSGPVTTPGGYALLAWNDLGMHCVDGRDYSVFSILPPYNNLHAQLVDKTTGKRVTSGVTLTYESIADDTVPATDPAYGSINTVSSTKTNFWQYVLALFGANPAPDVGLNLSGAPGNRTASTTPQPMTAATGGMFVAEGIPIIPIDDKGSKNFYPMVKVVARNAAGTVLATAKTVLPVSDEMTCVACHASTTSANVAANAARPAAGWVNDADPEKDWKKNILKLHDERVFADPAKKAVLVGALAAMQYDAAGLYATATKGGGEPVLCASCHSSNALATTGLPGIRALTHALHTKHADVKDPATQLSLSAINNRTACYLCHPGSVTQCLRGAMGNALDAAGKPSMGCQSCHGNLVDVGNTARTGWLSQPNCQACHHDGKRELDAVDATGKLKLWTDTRWATNANVPAPGYSLYRFSSGHGGLQCEACHGATHAEYPSSHPQDNALSIALQGHAGTVAECSACHASVPNTTNGGPHGMHTTGDAWVSRHEDVSKTGCTSCHGADYRGTPLSAIKVAKVLNRKSFAAGHQIGCYDCHNGPNP
jgi:hypothetical protein